MSGEDGQPGARSLEDLVEEFRAALRAGRGVDAGAFCRAHPELGEELQEALEAVVALETAHPSRASPTPERIGRYRILREIARGGMGVVYEAVQAPLERRVALKLLLDHRLLADDDRRRFEREARLLARLDHPGICAVYDSGVENGVPFVALRYLEGQTLAARIANARAELAGDASGCVRLADTAGGAPSADPRRVAELGARLARALHEAHEAGLVHRDVKPGNVMLSSSDEPVLLDFGLARDESELRTRLTRTGAVLGTPAFMAPEQVTGARDSIDRRTDVYALGATLYECLCLRRPFEGQNGTALFRAILQDDPIDLRRVHPAIGASLAAVIARCLEKERARRYTTAADLADELERCARGDVTLTRPLGPGRRFARSARRHPWRTAALALALAAVAAPLVISWTKRGETSTAVALERARGGERIARAKAAVDRLVERVERERLEGRGTSDPMEREVLAEALSVYRLMADAPGDEASSRVEAARAIRRVGLLHSEFQEAELAIAAFDRALEMYGELAPSIGTGELARQRATLLVDRAWARDGAGDVAAADADLTHALELLSADAEDDSGGSLPHVLLRSIVLRQRAQIALRAGRREDAEQHLAVARAELESLEPEHSRQSGVLIGLADIEIQLGDAQQRMGRPAEAEKRLSAAVALLTQGAAAENDPVFQERLARCWQHKGVLLYDVGRIDDAALAYAEALDAQEQFVAARPGHPQHREVLAGIASDLGNVLVALGCTSEGVKHLERSLALREELCRAAPDMPRRLSELAQSCTDLGQLKRWVEDPVAPLAQFDRAVELRRRAAAMLPREPRTLDALSIALSDAGREHTLRGDLAIAEPLAEEAAALGEWLVAGFPEIVGHADSLGQALRVLALVRVDQGREHDAADLARRGLAVRRGAVQKSPSHPYLSAALEQMAELTFRLLAARDDLDALADEILATRNLLPATSEQHRAAAYHLASIAQRERETPTPAPGRDAWIRTLEDAALAELRRAALAGVADVHALAADGIFDGLRDRPDFPVLPALK